MVALTQAGTDATADRLRELLFGIPVSTTGLDLFQTDLFYESGFAPLAVASPRNASEVQRIVNVALELGLSLSARGAGLSYSGGYIPANDRTLMVDTSGMDRIVEVNV